MAEPRVGSGVTVPVKNVDGLLIAEVTRAAAWIHASVFAFDCVRDAERYCNELEHQLITARLRDVLVDARAHDRGSREASEAIWTWVGTCSVLRRMALVNNSEHIALAIRMRNLALPVKKVKPFKTLTEAEAWLRDGA